RRPKMPARTGCSRRSKRAAPILVPYGFRVLSKNVRIDANNAVDTTDYHFLANYSSSRSGEKVVTNKWMLPGHYHVYYQNGPGPFYSSNSPGIAVPYGAMIMEACVEIP
ncbi:MAG: hypothetical protein ACNA8W_21775, partial [Bradymonadaceae bacterium]